MADTSSRLFDDSGMDGFTVVELPNLAHGKLADLISAAKAPGLPSELGWEHGIRSMFDQVAATWPKPHRIGKRPARVAIVAASVTTLLGTTTALSAASVLPPSAARVVDKALHQVGINVTPPPQPPSRDAGLARSSTVSAGTPAPRVVAPAPVASTTGCGLASGNVSTGALSSGGSDPCGAAGAAAAVSNDLAAGSQLAKYRTMFEDASPAQRVGGFMTATPATETGGNGTTTSGDGKGTSGAGGSTGVGGNRGGNQVIGGSRLGLGFGDWDRDRWIGDRDWRFWDRHWDRWFGDRHWDWRFWDWRFWDWRFWDWRFWDWRFWDWRFWDWRFWDWRFWDRGFGDRGFGDRGFGDRHWDRWIGDRWNRNWWFGSRDRWLGYWHRHR